MSLLQYFSASENILTKSVQSSPHIQSSPGLRYPKILSKEWSLPVWMFCLCVCNQGAYADNPADAVDRLLIPHYIWWHKTLWHSCRQHPLDRFCTLSCWLFICLSHNIAGNYIFYSFHWQIEYTKRPRNSIFYKMDILVDSVTNGERQSPHLLPNLVN